ncbi:MAG: Gfo/Idh/MocA family oxidoreductase [Deltaproteobacteria bacterium]|jgi:predicted dehydrogenase|nr:Gfo/Idh/MocA family oxidoreductase [Deltaproteobacteria bacterium]
MLRGGFIGFGRMGITHFSILNSHESACIVAVCDNSKTLLNVLSKYVDIRTYSDYREMLKSEQLDFVMVSTPTGSHAEVIKEAIYNNLHVFTEKPFTLTPEEGREALEHLEGRNLVNQVGYVNRFNEVFMEVKRLLDAGMIGEIKNFSSEMYGPTVLKDSKGNWRGKRTMGGGCMYEFASHCIDLVVYLLDQPEKVAGSIMQSIYSSGVDDLVMSNFVYNNGCSGTIMVNWSDETYRKPTNIVKIFGTKGKIIADKHMYKIFMKQTDSTNGFHQGWNTRYITDFSNSVRFYVRGNEFTRQLDYFVNCIKESRSDNISSFAEAHKTDVIMDNIRQDAARVLVTEAAGPQTSSILANPDRPTIWEKFSKLIGK